MNDNLAIVGGKPHSLNLGSIAKKWHMTLFKFMTALIGETTYTGKAAAPNGGLLGGIHTLPEAEFLFKGG